MKRRGVASIVSIALVMVVSSLSLPASAHETSSISVQYPQFGTFSVNALSKMTVNPNHYYLEIYAELQATNADGNWRVVDDSYNNKTQTCCVQVNVGTSCTPPTGGVAVATYYRTHLVFAVAYNSNLVAQHTYRDIYRPTGKNLNYARFCNPWPI